MSSKSKISRAKSTAVLSTMVLLGICSAVNAKYSGGGGIPAEPYRIATAEDLNDIGNHQEDWDKHFILVNDVNLAQYTGTQFKIIGPFSGVFDGNNHKILNFTWKSTGRNGIGLFGYIGYSGQVKNLGMENVYVNAGNGYYVGGLVEYNYGTITNCYSTGRVMGTEEVGGLVQDNYGTITNCYSTGNVEGDTQVGGLVGVNHYGIITNCYSTGRVTATNEFGGLVGLGGLVENSFWDIETSECNTSAGGTGKNTAEMKTKSTFTDAGWDFVEIWGIGENQTYPFLRTEPAGDSNHDKKVNLEDLAILASHWLEEN